MNMNRCIVVGAGMAGLTAARALMAEGWAVTVLDKGWNPGGRMATRRVDGRVFDHGAQFFTARDEGFQSTVQEWAKRGWVRPWCEVDGVVRWCSVDGMNGLAGKLAAGLDVRQRVAVERVEWAGGSWRVVTREETFEGAVVLTAPLEQCVQLLEGSLDRLPGAMVETMQAVAYEPCFAAMVSLRGSSAVPAPGYVEIAEGPVAFVADNTAKGISMAAGADVTIHSRAEWARANWEMPLEDAGRVLVDAARAWLGSEVERVQVHRWKYAKAVRGATERALVAGRLAVAGDGLGGARVEGAFLSGLAAAERLLNNDAGEGCGASV